jgi:hypothetical protein
MGTLKINKKVKLEAASFTAHKNPVSLFFFFFFFSLNACQVSWEKMGTFQKMEY